MAKHPYPENVSPVLVEKCVLLEKACWDRGVLVMPYFGYRDDDEQFALHLQGRAPLVVVNLARAKAGLFPLTENDNQHTVTDAAPGSSKHNRLPSMAVDFYVVGEGGKPCWSLDVDLNEDGQSDYAEFGEEAKKLGLVWGVKVGGRLDGGHVELPNEEPLHA